MKNRFNKGDLVSVFWMIEGEVHASFPMTIITEVHNLDIIDFNTKKITGTQAVYGVSDSDYGLYPERYIRPIHPDEYEEETEEEELIA